MIKAVVFDLDDTLYPEMDYVKSGFSVVASEAREKFGIQNGEAILKRLFDENKSGVLDRFASENGLNSDTAACFLDLYRNHVPNIALSDEAKNTLAYLRQKGYRLGIITDGRPQGQRNKISALGLANMVDTILITDELGGTDYRKPDPRAFEAMCEMLCVLPEEMMYVGDNPQKDFAVKKFLPITTVRVLPKAGIYSRAEFLYGIASDMTIGTLHELCAVL